MKKYETGTNMFGEKCIAKYARIHKETAKEQYIEIVRDIRRTGYVSGLPVEYDVEFIGFTQSELEEFYQWMDKALESSLCMIV